MFSNNQIRSQIKQDIFLLLQITNDKKLQLNKTTNIDLKR